MQAFRPFFHLFWRTSANGCFSKVKLCTSCQGRRNWFQNEGAMEHWKALSVTMVGRQEKCLYSRRYRMPKTVAFWPWWQRFNSFCFETLSIFFIFFPFFPFFSFYYAKNWLGMAPQPPLVSPACMLWTNFWPMFPFYTLWKHHKIHQ